MPTPTIPAWSRTYKVESGDTVVVGGTLFRREPDGRFEIIAPLGVDIRLVKRARSDQDTGRSARSDPA